MYPEVSHLADRETLIRCTHHHITPYLAKSADQMSIMIVVHLPQCGSHAGHEAPLEKRKKCIQYTIKFKLKAAERMTLCLWFWWILTSWVDLIWVLKQALPPRFGKVGALTQWLISLTYCPPLPSSLSPLIIMPVRSLKCCLYFAVCYPGSG